MIILQCTKYTDEVDKVVCKPQPLDTNDAHTPTQNHKLFKVKHFIFMLLHSTALLYWLPSQMKEFWDRISATIRPARVVP